MPIQEIKRGPKGPEIKKVCQNCGEVGSISADSLTLGNEHMPEAIVLPPCVKCSAVETLVRSTDVRVPDHLSAHRKSVNALSEYLLGKGKVAESAKALFADQEAKGIAAAPLGGFFGRVLQPKASTRPAPDPLALALKALAAAQVAVDATKAR